VIGFMPRMQSSCCSQMAAGASEDTFAGRLDPPNPVLMPDMARSQFSSDLALRAVDIG
jgi:hypothetical protein